jgi:serine/threonine-protein kinase
MTVICYNCRDQNSDQARFCKRCRTQLRCANCNNLLTPNMRFCPKCGATLNAAPTTNPTLGGQTFVRAMAPGDRLEGRYMIVRPLGKGGMGAVYLVEDARIAGRQLALKEMSEQGIDPAEAKTALEAFKREAQLLLRLDHANLPKVFDTFSDNNRHFLVMAFVTGKTLEKRLEEAGGALPEREVYGYAVQLCDVLDYLHRQQPPIIFRDLKPGNIMLKPDGRIKLIDFGIARHFKPGQSKDTQAMGTPGYAAPEQYGKGQSDARTDVYTLGATLHHAITGRDPGQDPFNFPAVRALNRTASPQLEAAIMRAVLIDRSQRWPSIAALRAGLDTNVIAPPPTVSVSPPVVPVLPPPKPPLPAIPPPVAQGASAAKPSAASGFRRAPLWYYLFVTGGMAAWLASPVSPLILVQIWAQQFGFTSVAHVLGLILPLLLAYLLTHQPASTALSLVMLIGVAPYFPGSFTWGLTFANTTSLWISVAILEFALLLSFWRTRKWWQLLLLVVGAVFLPMLINGLNSLDVATVVQTTVVAVVGVLAALASSAVVNLISRVGP